MLHEELTRDILKAFYEVHKVLGFGFLEQVYQNALYMELSHNGMKVECQKEILVYYKGECVGRYVADMIVNELGLPHTAHTTNPVPFCVLKEGLTLHESGNLGDVTPTMLELLGVEIPKDMTGKSMIKK